MSLDHAPRLVVGGLAVARLTRLATEDRLTAGLRYRVEQAVPAAEDFLACPWCVSVWIAAGWAVLATLSPSAADLLGAILAWSEVAGLAATVT